MPTKSKLLILLSDNNDADRQMLNEALKQVSNAITEAKTGVETLRFLSEQEFDCLVLDYNLPDYNGTDLIREIRKRGISVPIVVVTNRDDSRFALKMIRAGAQDYLPKKKATSDMISSAVINAMRLKKTMDETEYYKEFYDTVPVGFYTTCMKTGRFLKANPFCVKMLGCESFTDLSKNHRSTDFYSRTRRKQLIDILELGQSVTDFEIEIHGADGVRRWAILTARPCRNGDCIEGSITDITQRRLLELEIERLKHKEIVKIKAIGEQARARMNECCLNEL